MKRMRKPGNVIWMILCLSICVSFFYEMQADFPAYMHMDSASQSSDGILCDRSNRIESTEVQFFQKSDPLFTRQSMTDFGVVLFKMTMIPLFIFLAVFVRRKHQTALHLVILHFIHNKDGKKYFLCQING